jgi:two-component system, OmpR family, sensor histidine kinase VicK
MNQPYVNHFKSIFEELWKNGIDALDRIRDIEEGVDQADIEIISNPKEGIKRAWSIGQKTILMVKGRLSILVFHY